MANIIPGVSGGTMAVVLGIYDRLIGSLSALRTDFKKSLLFLFPVGVGAGVGILLFSSLIKLLLSHYPTPTNFFFIGLIIGGMPLIYRRALAGRFRFYHAFPFAGGVLVLLLMTFVLSKYSSTGLITSLTVGSALRLFFCSALAAACMILPGISGSMVMVVLGVYTSILNAISGLNIVILTPVALGVLFGVLAGAKLIDLCLRHFPKGTYLAILGLIVGSLVPVFLNAGFHLDAQGWIAVGTLAAGCVCALLMNRLQKWLDERQAAK